MIQLRTSLVSFIKSFFKKNDVSSDDTFLKSFLW